MKKMLSAQYLVLFVFGISLCIPQAVNAFPDCRFRSPFEKIFLRAVLDLTSEQVAALDGLKAATEAEVEPLESALEALGTQLPEVLLAEDIDTGAAEAVLQEMGDVQCEISSIGAHAGLDAFQIITSEKRFLTSEQRQALVVLAEDALDLFEYIADYPGWVKIKDDFEQYIAPALADLHPERISREPLLDLTDEQLAAFDQLQDDTYAAIEPLEEQIRVVSVELLGILMADTIVIEDAEDTLTQILAVQCDSISIGAASLLEGVQILTPEQRQLILEKIERKQKRWGMWRNRK
jgi:Spy/CpxP family protein refolding chaperone